MLKRLNAEQASKLRQTERERYLACNSNLPDAKQRWTAYEDLILRKYLPADFKPERPPEIDWRQQQLNRAWIERDLYHSRKMQES